VTVFTKHFTVLAITVHCVKTEATYGSHGRYFVPKTSWIFLFAIANRPALSSSFAIGIGTVSLKPKRPQRDPDYQSPCSECLHVPTRNGAAALKQKVYLA